MFYEQLTLSSSGACPCHIHLQLLDSSKNIQSLNLSTRVFPNEVMAQLMALTMLSIERLDVLNQLFNPGGNKFFIRPTSWLFSVSCLRQSAYVGVLSAHSKQ